MKFFIKKIAVLLLTFFEKVSSHIKIWRIDLNENIIIDKSAIISRTARIDICEGGKIQIGSGTEVLDGVLILTYGGEIRIGNRCSINPYTIIYGHGNTLIGDDVLIAGGCMIIPSNHIYADPEKPINLQGIKSIGITIESDVWIGHGCSILDGVTIGKGSIIAAGSIVNTNIPPMSIAVGSPAEVIKRRE